MKSSEQWNNMNLKVSPVKPCISLASPKQSKQTCHLCQRPLNSGQKETLYKPLLETCLLEEDIWKGPKGNRVLKAH